MQLEKLPERRDNYEFDKLVKGKRERLID